MAGKTAAPNSAKRAVPEYVRISYKRDESGSRLAICGEWPETRGISASFPRFGQTRLLEEDAFGRNEHRPALPPATALDDAQFGGASGSHPANSQSRGDTDATPPIEG